MRDPQRIDRILAQLGRVWKQPRCSDMRLTQLLQNMGVITHGDDWYTEDDQVEERIAHWDKKFLGGTR